jgi:hypothetical protein
LQDIIEAAFMITQPNAMWLLSDYNTAIVLMKLVGAHEHSDEPETNLVVMTRCMSHLLSLAAACLVASYEVWTVALEELHILWLQIHTWMDLNADSARIFKAVNEACLIPLLERQLRFVYTLSLHYKIRNEEEEEEEEEERDLQFKIVTEALTIVPKLFRKKDL